MPNTAQKMKFFIKNFSNKCDKIRLQIWSHLLEKSLMENFIFCAVKMLYGMKAFAIICGIKNNFL